MDWLNRYWHDPLGVLGSVAPWVLLAAGLVIVVWVVLGVRRLRAREGALERARWVHVMLPVTSTQEDAVRMWLNIAQLLGRRVHGWRPHLVFELVWIHARLMVGIVVPRGVSADHVRGAVQRNVPGSFARVESSPPSSRSRHVPRAPRGWPALARSPSVTAPRILRAWAAWWPALGSAQCGWCWTC